MHSPFRFGIVLVVALLLPVVGTSQGVTTAAITGIVTDSAGAPVVGARVGAVHEHLPEGVSLARFRLEPGDAG